MGCVGKRTQMEANGMDRGSGLCLLVGLTSITYVLKRLPVNIHRQYLHGTSKNAK